MFSFCGSLIASAARVTQRSQMYAPRPANQPIDRAFAPITERAAPRGHRAKGTKHRAESPADTRLEMKTRNRFLRQVGIRGGFVLGVFLGIIFGHPLIMPARRASSPSTLRTPIGSSVRLGKLDEPGIGGRKPAHIEVDGKVILEVDVQIFASSDRGPVPSTRRTSSTPTPRRLAFTATSTSCNQACTSPSRGAFGKQDKVAARSGDNPAEAEPLHLVDPVPLRHVEHTRVSNACA